MRKTKETNKKNIFQLTKTYVGLVKRHPDGFGFFVSDSVECPDIYIPKQEMLGVMTNDRVEIQPSKESNTDRYRGKIVKLLERSTNQVVGRLKLKNICDTNKKLKIGKLIDASFGWGEDLIITQFSDFHLEDGDWVLVKILSYPGEPNGFTGEIIKPLGDLQNPQNDSLRVLHQNQIPYEFSDKIEKAASKIDKTIDEKEVKIRKDLRGLGFVTIDGKTAKDFDDAIFVTENNEGFLLYVAIADVSHYVKAESIIDEEAMIRGNSVYFPNFVSPMLPEILSNDLCSLRPNEDRLAMVSEIKIDFSGQIIKSIFYEAVIKSKKRLTYGDAQEMIDTNIDSAVNDEVSQNVLNAANLAKILMNKRFREGSLNLEIPESEIELDESGEPVDIIRSERLFSHKLIEELMLIANVAVASFFLERNANAIFRIHESPALEKINDLERYLNVFGSNNKLSGGSLQKKIGKALKQFSGTPHEQILSILTLRSMSQAKYSPENLGHFGLAFNNYTHFTSPIRRYPDLIVHRVLKSLVCPHRGYRAYGLGELERISVTSSACEQRAAKAERQVKAIKKARFMNRHIGENYEGIISSVTKFGVFIVLRQFEVDGLVRSEDLPGKDLIYDEKHLRWLGKKSGMSYNIGDKMQVTIASANIFEGKIDFIPVTEGDRVKNLSEKTKSISKRNKIKKNSGSVRKTRVSRNRGKSKSR